MPSWVVTGASRGIGLEFVRQLASDPSNVVFALVRKKDAAKHLLPLVGGNLYALEADITDHKALKAAAAEVAKVTEGTLDVLINNAAQTAGQYFFTALTELALCSSVSGLIDQPSAPSQYRVNVVGVMYTINAFLPLLRAGSTKKIIALSSPGGDVEFIRKTDIKFMVAYAASKAALNMIVLKYAIQLREEGFICTAIIPTIVNSAAPIVGSNELPPGFQESVDLIKSVYPDWTPVVLRPEECAEICLGTISKLEAKDNGAFVSAKGGTALFED
ncbi:NAD-P-binding protein [Amylostereum chailletii]|nr:NAD-P-binding protein [Amylostereum chailletii]